MRWTSLAAALVLLSLAAPAASAQGAALDLVAPSGAVQLPPGEATGVPVRVHVVLADAVCSGEHDIIVRLAQYSPGNVDASIPSTVSVPLPAGGYVAQAFEADVDVTMMVTAAAGASGRIQVVAGYDVPASCVTTGDESATAQTQFDYVALAASAGSPASSPSAPLHAAPSTAAPAAASASPLVWILGVAVVALVFWIVGRLGRQVGGRDELP